MPRRGGAGDPARILHEQAHARRWRRGAVRSGGRSGVRQYGLFAGQIHVAAAPEAVGDGPPVVRALLQDSRNAFLEEALFLQSLETSSGARPIRNRERGPSSSAVGVMDQDDGDQFSDRCPSRGRLVKKKSHRRDGQLLDQIGGTRSRGTRLPRQNVGRKAAGSASRRGDLLGGRSVSGYMRPASSIRSKPLSSAGPGGFRRTRSSLPWPQDISLDASVASASGPRRRRPCRCRPRPGPS